MCLTLKSWCWQTSLLNSQLLTYVLSSVPQTGSMSLGQLTRGNVLHITPSGSLTGAMTVVGETLLNVFWVVCVVVIGDVCGVVRGVVDAALSCVVGRVVMYGGVYPRSLQLPPPITVIRGFEHHACANLHLLK